MLLQRDQYPEEGDLVICTVTKIQHSSVFAKLNEYNNKSGLIHISEISPGRIRNIRDYVTEGRVIVCVVLKIDEEKGYIDLSLRRVNERERRKKMEKVKQEQRAEKLIELLAKEVKIPVEEVYKAVVSPLLKKYEYVDDAFYQVVESNLDLGKEGVPKNYVAPLTKLIKEKIKLKEVTIGGALQVISYADNGLQQVQHALAQAHAPEKGVSISYNGGGKYRLRVVANEYKQAEQLLKNAVEVVQKDIEKAGGVFQFERKEQQK